MLRIIFFLIIFCGLLYTPLYSQQLRFEPVIEGLTNIEHITKDSLGFIWASDHEKLTRLSSFTKTVFKGDFKGEKIFKVYNIREKTFVSGTFGIFQIKNQNDQVLFFPVLKKAELPESKSTLVDIFHFIDGSYSLIYEDKLIHIDDNTLQAFDVDLKGVNNLNISKEGSEIVVFTNLGRVIKIELNEGKVYVMETNHQIYDYLPIAKGKFLVVGDGFYELTIQNGEWVFSEDFFNAEHLITSVAGIVNERVFVGTQGGGLFAAVHKNNNWIIEEVKTFNDPHEVTALPFFNISALHYTKNQELWVASESGISFLSQNQFFNASENFPYDNIVFLSGTKNGALCVVSIGLYHIKFNNNDLSVTKLKTPTNVTVMSAVESNGVIWYGDSKGNIYKFIEDKIVKIADLSDRGLDIFYLKADQNKNIWVCQAPSTSSPFKGVVKIGEDEKLTIYDEVHGLDSRIIVVKESSDGTMYLGGRGESTYLYKYNKEEDKFTNISLPLTESSSSFFETHDIVVDDEGVLWLATSNGLYRYNFKSIERINVFDIDMDYEVTAIEFDKGKIWFATNIFGLICYQPENGDFAIFGESDGLISNRIYYRNLIFDNNQYLWAGSIEGLSISQKSKPLPKVSTAPVIVSLNGENYNNTESQNLGFSVKDSIKFNFINTYFPLTTKFYTEYNLFKKGLEKPVISESGSFYSDSVFQIPLIVNEPGSYILKTRIKQDIDFFWSDDATIEFEVRNRWYSSWYIEVIYFLLASFIIFLFFRKRLDRLKRKIRFQNDEIKIKERELSSFSNIIAHDFKSLIRGISSVVQMLMIESQEKFGEEEKEYMHILKSKSAKLYGLIDWAVMFSKLESQIYDNRFIDLNEVIKDVIGKLHVPENIKIDVKENWPKLRGARDHFVEIFYQLLENAIKYNDKPNGIIELSFKLDDEYLIITVRDNGKGIQSRNINDLFLDFHVENMGSDKESAGLGLMMVKKIVKLHNGSVSVNSKPGHFTEFILKFHRSEQDVQV